VISCSPSLTTSHRTTSSHCVSCSCSQPIIGSSPPLSFTPSFPSKPHSRQIIEAIPVPGGILINEPITCGTVSGPAINGTIESDFVHPPIYENGTLQVAIIDAYGTQTMGRPSISTRKESARILSRSQELYVSYLTARPVASFLVELTGLNIKSTLAERNISS
jgi:hypothetical protein